LFFGVQIQILHRHVCRKYVRVALLLRAALVDRSCEVLWLELWRQAVLVETMQTVLIHGSAGVPVWSAGVTWVALMFVVVASSAAMAILCGQRTAVDESVKELAGCERE
jgi:hypothetical protein